VEDKEDVDAAEDKAIVTVEHMSWHLPQQPPESHLWQQGKTNNKTFSTW
jgi:hypothetical protein